MYIKTNSARIDRRVVYAIMPNTLCWTCPGSNPSASQFTSQCVIHECMSESRCVDSCDFNFSESFRVPRTKYYN